MQFASLGSGSKGNATVVRAGDTLVLIDCGFSLRETRRRLNRLGILPEEVEAILVTHEHSDHSSGVAALSREYRIPVYLTHGTSLSGRCDGSFDLRTFNCEDSFALGELLVKAITVPHDAAEPCQYLLNWHSHTLGILTDLGSITPHVVDNFSTCHSLILEFNHDRVMLQNGDYPQHLKRRVGGDWGHLSNEQAVDFLRQIDVTRLRHLVVAHVSDQNNSHERAQDAVLSVFNSLDRVTFAGQRAGFDWLTLI
ncbi:MAG: MBL fold metallo-hydrolase [Halioglobus sp.]|nr:MBL fold metallo-hydrolase [Halioglobus sp.]